MEKTKKSRAKKPKPEPSEEDLRKIAEAAIEHDFPIIRTTTVRGALGKKEGESFYHRHCIGEANMLTLVGKIRQIDPERYGHLEYTPIRKKPRDYQLLKPEEAEIIQDMLVDDSSNWKTENPPKSLFIAIKDKLQEAGFNRTLVSVSYQARKVWEGGYRKPNGEIPQRQVCSRQRMESAKIKKQIDVRVKELKEKNRDLEEIVDRDVAGLKRKEYLALASRGHQELIAFLMDPDNYKKHLDKDLELVAVDFTKTNTPPDLFEKYKTKVTQLQENCKEDTEVVAFVDNWLRCDMIFRGKTGVYAVVEVKQNAVNNANGKNNYPNADKVVEQLGAYLGGLRKRIQWKNKHLPVSQKVPENVYGFLAAYTIADDLKEYFNQDVELDAVVVPREEVIEAVRTPASEKKKRVRLSKHDRMKLQERKNNYKTLIKELKKAEPGEPIGTYSLRQKVIELRGNTLFQINGNQEQEELIKKYIDKGVILEGFVNRLNYKYRQIKQV